MTGIAVVSAVVVFVVVLCASAWGVYRGRRWWLRRTSQPRWAELASMTGLEEVWGGAYPWGGVRGWLGRSAVEVGSGGFGREWTRFSVLLTCSPGRPLTIEPRRFGAEVERFGEAFVVMSQGQQLPSQLLSQEAAEVLLSFAVDGMRARYDGARLVVEVGAGGLETSEVFGLLQQVMAAAHLLQLHFAETADGETLLRSDEARRARRTPERLRGLAARTGLEIEAGTRVERVVRGYRGASELIVTERATSAVASFVNTLGVAGVGQAHTEFKVVLPRDSGFGLRIRPTMQGGRSKLLTGDRVFDMLYAIHTDHPMKFEVVVDRAVRDQLLALARRTAPVALHGRFLSCRLDRVELSEDELVEMIEALHRVGQSLLAAFEVAERCEQRAPWAYGAWKDFSGGDG